MCAHLEGDCISPDLCSPQLLVAVSNTPLLQNHVRQHAGRDKSGSGSESLHLFPQQALGHFIASGTRPAQENLKQILSVCCEQFAEQGMGQGPCTLALRASQNFVYRELTGAL